MFFCVGIQVRFHKFLRRIDKGFVCGKCFTHCWFITFSDCFCQAKIPSRFAITNHWNTPTHSTCYSDVIIIRRSLLKTCECWALTRPPPPQQRKNFSTASQKTKLTPIVNIALSNQTLFSISIHLEPANTPSFFSIHFCWGAKTFQYPANKLSFYANGVSPLPPAKLTWQQSHRWVGEPLHDRSSIQVFCDERMVAKAEKI